MGLPVNTARHAEMVAKYEAGATLAEIGTEFGVTRERVRQIIAKTGGILAKVTGLLARENRRLEEGRLTQLERSSAISEYRHSLRMFQQDETVRLYQAGLSMLEVSKVVRGTDNPTWAQRVLEERGIDRRPVGRYSRSNPDLEPAYPWSDWLDCLWHKVSRGQEFETTTTSFRSMLYRHAHSVGAKVSVRVQNDVVSFCFFDPPAE